MKIIAHRGAWRGDAATGVPACPKNSKEAFEVASMYGFGIETDFRDICGRVVISHNPPARDALSAEEFFKITKPGQILAVNIKADGLAAELYKIWKELSPEARPFAFDMSVPDTLGYEKVGFPFFERQSEYERIEVWDKRSGFWLDGFSSIWYKLDLVVDLVKKYKVPVCVVSPELHNREYLSLWGDLKKTLPIIEAGDIYLCTDLPFEAQRFFNVIANEQ